LLKLKPARGKEDWLPGLKKAQKQSIETIIIPIKISTEKKNMCETQFREKNEMVVCFFQ
jgi:hypothetical protein